MIILDTNVLSALMRSAPERKVVSWLDRQPQGSIWPTSTTVLDLQVGLRTIPTATEKAELSEKFKRLLDSIYHRIAVFGEEAARLSAELAVLRQMNGRAGDMRDCMIAGIVLAHHASLATRNATHFSDIQATVVNPWAA
jgi:predicted nucleic acid-binding protein